MALIDFYDALTWIIDLLNPLWVLRRVFYLIFKYDPEDIVVENKSNRKIYYRNAFEGLFTNIYKTVSKIQNRDK